MCLLVTFSCELSLIWFSKVLGCWNKNICDNEAFKMNSKLWIFVALFAFCGLAVGHKYKSGECPQVEPMNGFEMKKVSVWNWVSHKNFMRNFRKRSIELNSIYCREQLRHRLVILRELLNVNYPHPVHAGVWIFWTFLWELT